jgi:hypothetical protein
MGYPGIFDKMIKIWLTGKYYEGRNFYSPWCGVFVYVYGCFLSCTTDNSPASVYFNIDLLPHDDTKWINELKQEKRSKKMVAYSKKGANAAKSKAIELGLKDVFVDFVSEEEADKRRGMGN